jgi:hypothetical protein
LNNKWNKHAIGWFAVEKNPMSTLSTSSEEMLDTYVEFNDDGLPGFFRLLSSGMLSNPPSILILKSRPSNYRVND